MSDSMVPEYTDPKTKFQHYQAFFLCSIAIIPNTYFLHRNVVKKISDSNRAKIIECKRILKGLIFQGLFTLIFQAPPLFYLIYYGMAFNSIYYLEIPLDFLFYIGNSLYVFFTVVAIKDLRNMMLEDIGIKNKIKPIFSIRARKMQ